jgi:hypothetical protein
MLVLGIAPLQVTCLFARTPHVSFNFFAAPLAVVVS